MGGCVWWPISWSGSGAKLAHAANGRGATRLMAWRTAGFGEQSARAARCSAAGVHSRAAPPIDNAPPRKDPTEPPYEPAAILARVGTEVVQAAEILPTVHQTLDSYLAKVADEFSQMPPEFQAEQRKKWHREVVLKTLDDVIKVKLLLTEVRSVVPEEASRKTPNGSARNSTKTRLSA